MVRLTTPKRGFLMLRFKVDAGRALATMVGSGPAMRRPPLRALGAVPSP